MSGREEMQVERQHPQGLLRLGSFPSRFPKHSLTQSYLQWIGCHQGLAHIYIFFFLLSELRTEPRALHLLGKRSTSELNPQPLQTEFLTCKCIFPVLVLHSFPDLYLESNP